MKRYFSTFLAMLFILGVVSPAFAAPTGHHKAHGDAARHHTVVDWNEVDGKPQSATIEVDTTANPMATKAYEDGLEVGYRDGEAEGEQKARIDHENGHYAPKYTEADFANKEFPTETYEDGYNRGFIIGYCYGYNLMVQAYAYEDGYGAGYLAGWDDGMRCGYAENIPVDPDDVPENYDTEEAYAHAAGFFAGYWYGVSAAVDSDWQQYMQAIRNEEIAELGGTPGQINVMMNGSMVGFPDAFPEMQNARTMVPVRAVVEHLGAEVELLEGDVVEIVLGDTTLHLAIGSDTVQVNKAGEISTVQLDCASYLKNYRTFVPLRFVSEALGYEVFWDNDYRTVIILDKAKLTGQLDTRFLVSNILLKTKGQLFDSPRKITGNMSLTAELLDSFNGNQTLNFSGNLTATVGGGGLDMDATVDLSAIAKFLAFTGEAEYWQADALAAVAKGQNVKLKITPEGESYLRAPLLDLLLTENGASGSGETWYYMGKTDTSMLKPEGYTVGNMLYRQAVSGYEPFYFHQNLMASADAMSLFMGDDSFTKKGSSYSWSVNMYQFYEQYYGFELDDYDKMYLDEMIRDFVMEMTFDETGKYTVNFKLKTRGDYYDAAENTQWNQSGSPSGDKLSFVYQIQNDMNIKASVSTSVTKVSQAPNTSLPADALVVDLTGNG